MVKIPGAELLSRIFHSGRGVQTTEINLGNMFDPQTGGRLERGADAQMASERKARGLVQTDETKKAEIERSKRVLEAKAELARQQEEAETTQTEHGGVTVTAISPQVKTDFLDTEKRLKTKQGKQSLWNLMRGKKGD